MNTKWSLSESLCAKNYQLFNFFTAFNTRTFTRQGILDTVIFQDSSFVFISGANFDFLLYSFLIIPSQIMKMVDFIDASRRVLAEEAIEVMPVRLLKENEVSKNTEVLTDNN